jgi:hypothetical protein
MTRTIAIVVVVLSLTGCTAMTTMSGTQPDLSIQVADRAYSTAPATDTFHTTTFGNYEFKASRPGQEPVYGLLPMKFNPGYLALDILFFTPAMFLNLREVYPYYNFDVDKRVIQYRLKLEDPWSELTPTETAATRAKNYFNGLPRTVPAGAATAAPSPELPASQTQ